MYVKFSDSEVAIACNEGIAVRIRAKLDVFINHGFTQIDLPSVKANVAPAVYLDYVIFPLYSCFFTSSRYTRLLGT